MWMRRQSTLHKQMEEVMDTKADIITTEEALTINIEVEDTKATRTMENPSIWMTEETSSGTFMETQSTHQKDMIKPLPFILQVWKVTEVIEAEELQEEKEDLIKDMDQDEEQTEDLIKDMDQDEELVKDSAEDMDQVEEQIGEQKEDMIEDKDPIGEQEKDRTEDTDLAEEDEEEHNMVPKTKVKRGIARCAKSEDTIHYFTVPSYQNIFPEVTMSNLFPEKYVNSAFQLLVTSRIVLITTQRTTMTGCASRAR